jgi:hypothetical protein
MAASGVSMAVPAWEAWAPLDPALACEQRRAGFPRPFLSPVPWIYLWQPSEAVIRYGGGHKPELDRARGSVARSCAFRASAAASAHKRAVWKDKGKAMTQLRHAHPEGVRLTAGHSIGQYERHRQLGRLR